MKKITDESFKKYGKVISNLDFSDLLEKMNATQVPEDVIYVLPNEIGKKCFAYAFFMLQVIKRLLWKNDKKVTLKRQYIG